MSERRFMWAALGLLIFTMILFGLVMVPRLGEEATPEPTPTEPGQPALAAAPSPTAVQTMSPVSPLTVSAPTSTAAPQGQPTQQPDMTPESVQSGTQSPADSASGPGPSSTATPAAIGSPTASATASTTSRPGPSPSASPAASSTPPPTPASSPTPSPSPSATPTPTSTATATPQQTPTPGPTATPSAPGIAGRVLLAGEPVEPDVVLVLEDQAFNQIAEAKVEAGGSYHFPDVPAATNGYNITFSWEDNQQYGADEVIAWGWIGPVAYDGQGAVRLPDFDIGLLGLEHMQPEPDTSLSLASISPATPLLFTWSAHPAAARYWVDLLSDGSLERVWHSALRSGTSADFDGRLDDGSFIEPGTYWWAAGGQGTLEGFQVTTYGRLAALTLTP